MSLCVKWHVVYIFLPSEQQIFIFLQNNIEIEIEIEIKTFCQ